MTQLHISQLGLLSVSSAGNQGGQEAGYKRAGREKEVGGRQKVTGKSVAAARPRSLKLVPGGISDVALT